jgi:xylan 1,4-beta-xylosidase
MVWNYHDADRPAPSSPVTVTVRGLPPAVRRVRLIHYRLDDSHSNAYTVWKAMGSPQRPTPEQVAKLKAQDGLQLLESPRWLVVSAGTVIISADLPRQAISLLQLDWQSH